ncbi:MAG TPA: 2-oxoacid:acceptor oxidoreductase family protein [Kiritimatiellia bacterium]
MAKTEIRIAGFGGQGVILCGMIIGKSASIFGGRHATLIQSFGPEARGSACSAQVTIADSVVDYPYIKQPDILISMSPDAHKLFAPQVKPGGLILFESDLVAPAAPANGIRSAGIPATRIAEEIGRRMITNIVMVGFFAQVTQLISREAFEKAVLDSVPPGTEELNLAAFKRGYEFGGTRNGESKAAP